MKLPASGKLYLKGKFNQKAVLNIEADKAVSLKISPNSVVIYEISEKK